jgi:MerR family transcriptional regulator, copper efflux regulator
MAEPVTIGRAAAELGLEPHVLRHWEDVDVLVALRTKTGHRRYDDELLTRARLIRLCQRAGLSLADIAAMYLADRPTRVSIIADNRVRIANAVANLQQAERFLAHVLDCVHPIVSECPQCADFAAGEPPSVDVPVSAVESDYSPD